MHVFKNAKMNENNTNECMHVENACMHLEDQMYACILDPHAFK